jgi:hypothetical protein
VTQLISAAQLISATLQLALPFLALALTLTLALAVAVTVALTLALALALALTELLLFTCRGKAPPLGRRITNIVGEG